MLPASRAVAFTLPYRFTRVVEAFYIHIPFCRRKCFYCDFAITTGNADLQARYVDVLCQEIKLTAPSHSLPLRTIFFGGGTPSLLTAAQVAKILSSISDHWAIAAGAEISLEANPGTVTIDSLTDYKSLGINRISLGVQAFQDQLLNLCGRGHSVAQIYEAVGVIKKAGITNFSLDLISGLPNQTPAQWQDSLDQAIALEPQHLSVYDLTIEPDTAFGKRYQPDSQPLPSEEQTVEMYLMASDRLGRAGYEHYEISNYAITGYGCKHNLVYWHNQPFYGVGMGATSYVDRRRFDRPRKMRPYLEMVTTWAETGQAPVTNQVSDREALFDTLMQGLRLHQGIKRSDLESQFPKLLWQKAIATLEKYSPHWVEITTARISLTQPTGWLFSDGVIADLYACLLRDE